MKTLLTNTLKSAVTTAMFSCAPIVAHAVPLTFDQMVGPATGSNLLGATAVEQTIYFKDVATDGGKTIDAMITTTIKQATDFADQINPNEQNYFGDAGYIPDYRNAVGGPQDDLGFLYYGNGVDGLENGITMTLSFFDGTGDLSETFSDAITLSTLEIAVYDVDGEASQSEYFTASKADGLVSYATGTTPQALVATDTGDAVLFEGPSTNFAESDATGAAILYYELTNALTLDFGSVQSSGPNQNAVFSAIDGDLSLFQNGGFGDVETVTSVPLPAGGLLLFFGLAASGAFLRSQRPF